MNHYRNLKVAPTVIFPFSTNFPFVPLLSKTPRYDIIKSYRMTEYCSLVDTDISIEITSVNDDFELKYTPFPMLQPS